MVTLVDRLAGRCGKNTIWVARHAISSDAEPLGALGERVSTESAEDGIEINALMLIVTA